jgi:hypothetical protein
VQARLVGLSKHSYSDVGEAGLEDMARTGIEAFSVAVQRAAPGCDADQPVGFVLAALDRRTRDRSTVSDAVLQTLRLVENLVSPGWPYRGPHGMAEINEDRRRRYFEVEFKKSVLRELRLARSSLVGEQPALLLRPTGHERPTRQGSRSPHTQKTARAVAAAAEHHRSDHPREAHHHDPRPDGRPRPAHDPAERGAIGTATALSTAASGGEAMGAIRERA